MEQWFEGKAALVTGGGDGIGRAAAILFAQRGARVVVTDVRRGAADDTAAQIAAIGGEAIALDGDVTDDAIVAAFITGESLQINGGMHLRRFPYADEVPGGGFPFYSQVKDAS